MCSEPEAGRELPVNAIPSPVTKKPSIMFFMQSALRDLRS